MIKNIIWTSVFVIIAGILQSTLLSPLSSYFYAVPDIALCILVYSSYINGTMTGQLSGFSSGLLLDFLSEAPLGLNTFVRTTIGALTGFLKGNFFLDIIFLPVALCAGATVLKAVLIYCLHFLFGGAVPSYSLNSPKFFVELLMNAVLAPFLFRFLKLFNNLLVKKRDTNYGA